MLGPVRYTDPADRDDNFERDFQDDRIDFGLFPTPENPDQHFMIFCKVCGRETFAFKHYRHRGCSHIRGDMRRYGRNQCVCCETVYDAPLPDWWPEREAGV